MYDRVLVAFDVFNSFEDVLDVSTVSKLPGAMLEENTLVSWTYNKTGSKESSISLHVAIHTF